MANTENDTLSLKPGDRVEVTREVKRLPREGDKPSELSRFIATVAGGAASVPLDKSFVVERSANAKKDGAPLPHIHVQQGFPSFEFKTPVRVTGSFKADGKSTVPPHVMLGKNDGIEAHEKTEDGNLSLTVRISGIPHHYVIEKGAKGITFAGEGKAVTVATDKDVEIHPELRAAPKERLSQKKAAPAIPAETQGAIRQQATDVLGDIRRLGKQPRFRKYAEIIGPLQKTVGGFTHVDHPEDGAAFVEALDTAVEKLKERAKESEKTLLKELENVQGKVRKVEALRAPDGKTGMTMPQPPGIPPALLDKAVAAVTLPKSEAPLIIDINRKTTEPPSVRGPGGGRSIT